MPALIITEGNQKGLFLKLGHAPVVLGRDPSAALQIDDQMASRRHLQVRFDDARKGYVLTDMKSANGTVLNGRPVTGETPLAENDQITVGGTTLLFTGQTPADGASALEVLKSAAQRQVNTVMGKR
jgi:pSer/pThr/pTyr-binding forkhead associated (FHA) protein